MENKKIPVEKMNKLVEGVNSRQYGYVLFDNCPKSYDNARIRTGILPEDDTYVYEM